MIEQGCIPFVRIEVNLIAQSITSYSDGGDFD